MTTAWNKPPGTADPWALALRMLGRRDFSTAELRQRLAGRGVAEAQVREVVERCLEYGYLDDARYAEQRARALVRQGKAVGSRLLYDLRQRGIDDATAHRAMERAGGEQSDAEILRDLVARRFPRFDYATAPANERRRVVHFLQRRGFPLQQILDHLTEKG